MKIDLNKYSSKKHPVLEYIFKKYYVGNSNTQKVIPFTLKDISDGYKVLEIPEPASISNTILDLVRKKNPISSRLPESIYSLGYDLRKKTGKSDNGNLAGEFLFVGIGNEIKSWLEWKKPDHTIEVNSNLIPEKVKEYLRNDEGALFSVLDYCDILSIALKEGPNSILRVQNPMKWQPNEIDGFYINTKKNIIYPVEAKALTTKDEINLEQLKGGLKVVKTKYSNHEVEIKSIAIKMEKNSLKIACFKSVSSGKEEIDYFEVEKFIDVIFNPILKNWV
jgi:hypothetical protein